MTRLLRVPLLVRTLAQPILHVPLLAAMVVRLIQAVQLLLLLAAVLQLLLAVHQLRLTAVLLLAATPASAATSEAC